jgi:DNA repair protein RadC
MDTVIALSKKKAKEKPHYTGHRARLRERFLNSGADALADYELLEMVLFPAKPLGDVKPLAKALIAHCGGYAEVLNADASTLKQVAGCNDAAIAAIKLVRSAAERLLRAEVKDRPIIQTWTSLLDYCRLNLGHKKHEEFHVLFLNHKFHLIADEMQQKGTIDHTPVYPREVIKRALELGASGIIMVHNHPTGDTTPSKSDIEMTKLVVEAARPLNVRVHDHLIISGKGHYSFKAYGLV